MILDAHHHLWNYSAEEYGWIGDGMERLAGLDFVRPESAEACLVHGIARP